MNKPELEALLEQCRTATGPDRELDWRIADLFDIPEPWKDSTLWPPFGAKSKFDKSIPTFSACIDASIALIERVLPGWILQIHGTSKAATVMIYRPTVPFKDAPRGDCGSASRPLPIAIICAGLQALISTSEAEE